MNLRRSQHLHVWVGVCVWVCVGGEWVCVCVCVCTGSQLVNQPSNRERIHIHTLTGEEGMSLATCSPPLSCSASVWSCRTNAHSWIIQHIIVGTMYIACNRITPLTCLTCWKALSFSSSRAASLVSTTACVSCSCSRSACTLSFISSSCVSEWRRLSASYKLREGQVT